MWLRVFWGVLAALVFIVIIWLGGVTFTLTVGVFLTLTLLEYAQLLKKQLLQPQPTIMLTVSLILLLLIHVAASAWGLRPESLASFGERLMLLILVVVFFTTFINEVLKGAPEQGFITAIANIFGTVYVGFMFAYILLLRFHPDGLKYVIFTTGVTWVNDASAYFVGVNWGKHKLCPKISPHKSVEGSLGGIAGGVIIAGVLGYFFDFPIFSSLVLGFLVVVVGQLGDLIESILKRNAGVKDSGSFLPGHGGFLDRIDSLLLAAPVVYYAAYYLM